MPKELHDRLMKSAIKKGLKGDRLKAYVHGTIKKAAEKKKKK